MSGMGLRRRPRRLATESVAVALAGAVGVGVSFGGGHWWEGMLVAAPLYGVLSGLLLQNERDPRPDDQYRGGGPAEGGAP